MKGIIPVTVSNSRVQYRFQLKRNITILRGDSATGKTTLIELVAEYDRNPQSGITIKCPKECAVIEGRRWQEQLMFRKDSIIFIDEANDFLSTDEFASAVKKSDNYYVIVEDSNAGYRFFSEQFSKLGIPCVSAKGKSNIAKYILSLNKAARILVIADGAAFGPEMEPVLRTALVRDVQLYLPESFEWIVLASGLLKDSEVDAIVANPNAYIESREYFSWERFFTELLKSKTRETYLAYNKKKLNPVYLQEHESKAIMDSTPLKTDGE